jgi:hypothetical protein
MGQDIPASFFSDLESIVPAPAPSSNGMRWYDQIIDDMLANPGTNMVECAKRLGRAPNTIRAIVNSDLFRARWSQRRQQFEEELNRRIVAKMTKAAELSLDLTIETMEKKRDAIPLPVLSEITKSTLDRLGYGPSRSDSAANVTVSVNNNVVSAEALASAREKLKLIEGKVNPPAPVAGPELVAEGEGDG